MLVMIRNASKVLLCKNNRREIRKQVGKSFCPVPVVCWWRIIPILIVKLFLKWLGTCSTLIILQPIPATLKENFLSICRRENDLSKIYFNIQAKSIDFANHLFLFPL